MTAVKRPKGSTLSTSLEDTTTEVAVDPTIDHPEYYGGADSPYEAVKVIQAWTGADMTFGFCIGNALKYLCRAGKKEPESMEALKKDLKKARWYLDYSISLLGD